MIPKLNELVRRNTRAVLPGFVYQLGNLLASVNATLGHQSPSIMGITTAQAVPGGRDGGDCHTVLTFLVARPGDQSAGAGHHQPLSTSR